MGSQRVGHNWATNTHMHTHTHTPAYTLQYLWLWSSSRTAWGWIGGLPAVIQFRLPGKFAECKSTWIHICFSLHDGTVKDRKQTMLFKNYLLQSLNVCVIFMWMLKKKAHLEWPTIRWLWFLAAGVGLSSVIKNMREDLWSQLYDKFTKFVQDIIFYYMEKWTSPLGICPLLE